MDQEAVKNFLQDTREKRLAIAAAKERMERTGQDVETIKSVRMDTKVQTNHQFDLAEFVERLEEAKLAYLKSYEAWITRAGVVYRILDAAGCHAELWATISRRYLWALPWDEVAKQLGVSRRMANTYERQAIERIAASEAAGEIITRAGLSCDLPIQRTASRPFRIARRKQGEAPRASRDNWIESKQKAVESVQV